MSDEKKSRSSEKVSLKDLGVISPMDELREQMDALRRPSSLAELRELTRPSYLTDLRAELEALRKPSYLTDLQAGMAALTKPSYLADLRSELEALRKPSYLTDLQVGMAALTKPSYLADLRSEVEALRKPSYLTDLQAGMAALTKPSYLADLRAEMAEVTRPSYLAELRAQMAELTRPSYLTELQGQVAAMASGTRMEAELAAVVGSYRELISGSALASYLVAPDNSAEPQAQVVRVKRFDSTDFGIPEVEGADQARSVDLEIVKAISEGEVAKLSPTATQRLHSVYLLILAIWDMLLRIVQTYMAYVFLTTLLSGSSAPADIPVQAALLTNEQRVLLADYRVVNREGARLRVEPTTQSKAIASLPFAHPVEVIEYNDKGWYRVETETSGGYLEGWMYVSVTSPLPKPKYPRGHIVDADTD